MFNSFKLAFAMYSKIPMPKADWSKEKMRYVLCFFPLVGVAVGAVMAAWCRLSERLSLNLMMTSCGYVLIPLLITGGIHMDGYLDTIDARHSYQSKERKLEILKDSHTGAFAIIFGLIYLVACLGVFSGVDRNTIPVISVSYVFSRSLSGLAAVTFKGARKEGMLASFAHAAQRRTVIAVLTVYLLAAAGLMLWLAPVQGAAAVVTGLAVFGYYRYFSYREFGGTTGDLAGYFLQLCELWMAGVVVVVSMVF